MDVTFLHRKPVIYGSPLANGLFLAVVLVHIIFAALAPISAIVAFATKKGGRLHVKAGKAFAWSMITIALSGIALDVVRLTAYVKENHTKYATAAMPSTYPARFAFLYAGLCVLAIAWNGMPPRVFRRTPSMTVAGTVAVPSALFVLGLMLLSLILFRYNPWTSSSVWMISTFTGLVLVMGRFRLERARGTWTKATAIDEHGFAMSFLAGFSWWAVPQGFGPGIKNALKGVDPSVAPYVGDQPGPFSPIVFFILVPWSLSFLLGAWLWRRSRKARLGERGATERAWN
jgi:hypothetical protein